MNLRIALAFLGGYIFLDWVSYIHPLLHSSITPWNPHPALAIALLAIRGQRWLPVVLAGVLGADIVVRHMSTGWPEILLVSVVLSLGYAAMAVALASFIPLRLGIATRSEMASLLAVVTLGSLVTGGLYVGALWASGALLPGPYFEALLQFWIGDCVGILVTLPVLLMLRDPSRRDEIAAMLRHPVAWIQAAAIGASLWLIFGPVFAEPFKFFYILFLPLIWIAVRFGLAGSALAMLAIQAGVIVAAQWTRFPALTVFELQALLIALTVTGLFLGVIVDERRRAAEELRDSLRLAAAGEMSAALAHELNQPLTALANYARAGVLLAEADEIDRARLVETLRKVVGETNRAADVVRRLRDFFRTGSTALAPASLADITGSVFAAMRPRATLLGVELEQDVAPGTPQVLADALQIEVVLRNLVANSIDAIAERPAPRRVRVEAGPGDAGFVRTVVRDSGSGVPEALGRRVFEPFFSARAGGMGMGLAISRAIIEAHGGQLWVETKGHGVLGFTLPIAHD